MKFTFSDLAVGYNFYVVIDDTTKCCGKGTGYAKFSLISIYAKNTARAYRYVYVCKRI